MSGNTLGTGFAFQIKILKIAKGLFKVSSSLVTIPKIMDVLDESLEGKERYNMSQRIRMFFRKLEADELATRLEREGDEDTIYKLDFEKLEL